MAERTRPAPLLALVGLGAMGFVLLYPLVTERVVALGGVRGLAAALLVFGGLSRFAVSALLPVEITLGRVDQGILVGLILAALASGERIFLYLLPAWIQLALYRIFASSLREPESIVERVAFTLQPFAPDFMRPYCKRSTRFWSLVFLANAAGIAALALFAPPSWWRIYTGLWIWVVMGAIALGEFVLRKTYFRAYTTGPIDRLFARFFPPDATEMGRRSNEYRRAKRISLGREP